LLDDIAFTGVTGIAEKQISQPRVFQLNQNYPNPFNPSTSISFSVPSEGTAVLKIFNLLGQEVGELFNGSVVSGALYRATFNASSLSSGVYFSRLEFLPEGSSSNGAKQLMRKMTLLR
jgi:hypothetical protein